MTHPDESAGVTAAQLERIAEQLGVSVSDYAALREMADDVLAGASELRVADPVTPKTVDANRSDDSDLREDPHNAWITRCTVTAADDGVLAEKDVGVKDNLALAGYPMTCGSRSLERFEPEIDATAVSRVLAAGATVVGKTNMDTFAFGGTGDLQEFGATLNPHDTDRLAGGSSSGSAAAVAAGECDVGLGTDQAGSVRGPSAWCGCVGMKPTHGLVPYTGGLSTDRSIDHVGVITRSVRENARTLGVVAGPDVVDGVVLDPRQQHRGAGARRGDYLPGDTGSLDGVCIGVVAEGFDRSVSDSAVDETVSEAVETLADLGAETRTVSLPALDLALPLMNLVVAVGVAAGPFEHGGVQAGAGGWHWRRLADALGDLSRNRPDELPPPVAVLRILGTVLDERGLSGSYVTGKNATLAASRRLATHFETCDVLALPTTPMLPFEADDSLTWLERIARNADALVNTAVFDHTGNPALTVPCGTRGGLPVGVQFVGPRFAEATLYRVGRALEAVI